MSERRMPPWPHPARRLVIISSFALALSLAFALAAWDARARIRAVNPALVRATALLVGPELSLHSASRWLRHPTRVEPWAASADGPALLDLDPAGALVSPPTALLQETTPAAHFRKTH